MIWYFEKYGDPKDHIENCKILKNFTQDEKLLLTLDLAIEKFEDLDHTLNRIDPKQVEPADPEPHRRRPVHNKLI